MELKKKVPFEPYEGREPYIFVSYSHKDSNRVLPILTEMNRRGYRVWYDEGIPWTSEWPAVIEEHLHYCGVCLAFHSHASMESDHCRREIHYALKEKKPILSAYLENIQLRHGLGLQLSLYQSVKLSAFPQIDDFVAQLEQESVFLSCRGEKQPSLSDVPNWHDKKLWLGILAFLLVILFVGAVSFKRWKSISSNTITVPIGGTSSDTMTVPAGVRMRYGPWSDWSQSQSQPPSPPHGCTVNTESREVVVEEDVPEYVEYRYGRWLGATSNWCKEYGESLHGGTYSVQETEWSTVRAVDTNTHWLCGHFDNEHPSHINASAFDSRGYPMWTKYIVDGYSDPEFYWEETRLNNAIYYVEYRWRLVYYDYTVTFDANGGEVSFTKKTVTYGGHYGELPTPSLEYYDFVGWFTKPDGGKQITESTVNLSGNQTLYAHWKYNPSA